MQVGTTKDQVLYNKPSAAVHPGALAAGTLPQYNTMYRASYYNVLTNEMHNSYIQFLFHSFFLLYMFRTNLAVHHQEHGIIYCISQCSRYNRAVSGY